MCQCLEPRYQVLSIRAKRKLNALITSGKKERIKDKELEAFGMEYFGCVLQISAKYWPEDFTKNSDGSFRLEMKF